jgi:hypothetical protein
MRICLKKGRDGPSTLTCIRANGSRTWGREHPFFPVHDLTHCAVESVLGFEEAFFGLIAAGWDIDDFARPRAHHQLPFQALVAEHIVAVLDREGAQAAPTTAAELNEAVLASLGSAERVQFPLVTDAQLRAVRALRARLAAQWHDLPPGATLAVAFPATGAA